MRKKPILLPIYGAGIFILGIIISLAASRLDLYGSFMQPLSFVLGYTYFGRCVEFLAGIGLALWLRKRGDISVRRGTTLLGVGAFASCLGCIIAISWDYQPTEQWPVPLVTILLNNFVIPFAVAVIFYGLVFERTRLQWLLETKLFDLLGKSSYAFYLIHLGLLSDLLEQVIGRNVLGLFIIFNLLAILLYKFVEHPIHTFITGRFRRSITVGATK